MKMRAAFYTDSGVADTVLRVGDQPTPLPGAGEVRVRLRTSGVNPSDVKKRSGLLGGAREFPLIIPHSDGAGDIDLAGSGVANSRVGERVWIWNGQWRRPHGTAAQYIVVPSNQAVKLPEQVGYDAGACFGIPALTAYQAVHLAEAAPGRTVLVAGGAGAVGQYAIQIAKAWGSRVLATVSSDSKATLARKAGADEAINYKSEDVGARVKELTAGRGVDAIIELDLTANGPLIPSILKPHGTVVVYGLSGTEVLVPARWLLQNTGSLRFFLVYDLAPQDRTAALGGLDLLLREGRLMHLIANRFPLEEIAQAHQAVESGRAVGNVIVDIA
jgi:NADPH:quinone reductase